MRKAIYNWKCHKNRKERKDETSRERRGDNGSPHLLHSYKCDRGMSVDKDQCHAYITVLDYVMGTIQAHMVSKTQFNNASLALQCVTLFSVYWYHCMRR